MGDSATASGASAAAPRPACHMTTGLRFAFAGVSAVGATLCVHPLDVVRVRLQLDSERGAKPIYSGGVDCARQVLKKEGARGMYNGLTAGVFRQLVYGMPRMATYTILLNKVASTEPGAPPPVLWQKFLMGMTAGAVGSVLGCPSEVCLVRMTSDSRLPPEQRRNYRHVGDALVRIAREEGVLALWNGAGATVVRSCLLTSGQLSFYSEAKTRLAVLPLPHIPLQFLSSLIAAFGAVALSCPADVVKSRLQNSAPGQYRGLVDCASTLVRNEGVLALWKGFFPSWIKVAPHTVISLLILDNLTKWYTGKAAL